MLLTALLQRLLELTQQLLLFLVQAHRCLDRYVAVKIAGIAGTQPAYALAAQAERLAGLRALGNGDGPAPGKRGHLELAAQGRRGERNGQFAVQVIAVTREDAVRLEVNLDVKVARGPAVYARFAIARRADAHAVVDTGRNLDLQGLVAARAPHPVAGVARVGDLLARTMTGGAGLLHAEETLLHAHHARTVAGVAGARVRARLGATAATHVAGFPTGYTDFRIEAVGRLLERDIERVFQIGAAIHLWPAAAPGRTENLAEDIAEGICKAARSAHAGTDPGVRIDARMTEAIVGRPLLLVGKHLVGLLGLLEFFLGLLAIRIAVRMVLHGQLAVSLLDLLVGGVLGHPQYFVVIAFCHLIACVRDVLRV